MITVISESLPDVSKTAFLRDFEPWVLLSSDLRTYSPIDGTARVMVPDFKRKSWKAETRRVGAVSVASLDGVASLVDDLPNPRLVALLSDGYALAASLGDSHPGSELLGNLLKDPKAAVALAEKPYWTGLVVMKPLRGRKTWIDAVDPKELAKRAREYGELWIGSLFTVEPQVDLSGGIPKVCQGIHNVDCYLVWGRLNFASVRTEGKPGDVALGKTSRLEAGEIPKQLAKAVLEVVGRLPEIAKELSVVTFGLWNDGRFYAFDVDFASPFDFPEESSLALKRFYSKRESELR